MGDAKPSPPRLEMRGITKRYPGVIANNRINLDVKAGEIHALLGENGAGKTTLMNVLFGLAHPDEGEILLDGEPVQIADPADAIARGIGMVHQHFMLIPVLTVAENILLGAETMANAIFLDQREARRRIIELGKRFGFEIDPDAKVETLSVGWQQRVEILKALYREAQILVLDEPTAVLTPQETVEIFAVLRRLAAEGKSIIFISHKLYEVLEIADRITVIRRGEVVGTRLPAETNEDDLAALMVGREVQLAVDRGVSHPAEPVLRVDNLTVRSERGQEAVRGVSFNVRAGEILGIAGVAGNGQDELVEAITGLRRPSGGTIQLTEQEISTWGVRERREYGLGYVPGDRQKYGLVLSFPISDNLVLTRYYHHPFTRGVQRQDAAIEQWAQEKIKEYDIRTPSWEAAAGTLSGGNQQKVIVAREFSRDLKVLVLDQPTRGLDVGSIEFIHKQAIHKRDAGTAILLISAELDEILELADRIAVMYRGEIVALVDGRPKANKEEIGLLMATGGRTPVAGPSNGGTSSQPETTQDTSIRGDTS
ncbi:MAG: ABC transporter ATP-binding protein [Chloroflexota bacterium]|nr:ABC transporter ATP-binding protein [Chloroflexota bacterium]